MHSLDHFIARRFGRLAFYVDCRKRLSKVTAPSLIIQSKDDVFTPRSVGHCLHEHLPGSQLREIEPSGHCPHMTHPMLVIDVMKGHPTAAA